MLRYFPLHDVWSEIGQLRRGVSGHAIVEANLDAICAATGNHNPIIIDIIVVVIIVIIIIIVDRVEI